MLGPAMPGVATEYVPTRMHVWRALKIAPWADLLLLMFSPVFALLAVVCASDGWRSTSLFGVASAGSLLVAGLSFIEQGRRISLVQRLARERRQLAIAGIDLGGSRVRAGSELRFYPICASFFFVTMRTTTCPWPSRRPGAMALAILLNVLMGWWSLEGLVATPFNLVACARGGLPTTPRELLRQVDDHPRPDLRREALDMLRLIGFGILALVVIIAVCAVAVNMMM
jgi:hypothetical protein